MYNCSFIIFFIQLNAIRGKYAELENNYRSSRDENKQKLSVYKEEADIKLTKLHDKLQSLRSEISNLHVVSACFVNMQKETDLWNDSLCFIP